MDSQWVTWALQGLIGVILIRIWNQLDTATKDISAVRQKIAEEFVTKSDWESMRIRLHDIEDWISGQKALAQLSQYKRARKEDL
jgi:hypothetical protein